MMSRTAKRTLSIALTLAAGVVAWSTEPTARAGSASSNLSVTASVSANCTISTQALAFGAYDPVSANASSPLTGAGGVIVACTTGSGATITLGQGTNAAAGSTDAIPLRQMKDSGSDLLTYDLFADSGRTTVWGNTSQTGQAVTGTGSTQTLSVYGSIAAGQNVPSGSYADTVVATVSF